MVPQQLVRATQSLVLWGHRHCAFDGKLDEMLSRSKRIQHMTVSSLRLIGMAISKGISLKLNGDAKAHLDHEIEKLDVLPLLTQATSIIYSSSDYVNDFELGSDDGSSSGDELNTLMEQIEELNEYVGCLIELDLALENPVLDPDVIEKQGQQHNASLELEQHHYFYLRIKDLFANISDDIAAHLGKAHWHRYCQLSEIRRNAEEQEKKTPEVLDSQDSKTWHDSGIGTSIQTGTVYAKTIHSKVSAMGYGKYSPFPPLSKEAKSGDPFQCDACGQCIVVTKPRLWKQHLIKDLRPYLCIYPPCPCSQTAFPSRDAWMDHMKLDHRTSELFAKFTCPFCLERKEGETQSIVSHVSKHLETLSTIALPRIVIESDELTDTNDFANAENVDSGDETMLNKLDSLNRNEASLGRINESSHASAVDGNIHKSAVAKDEGKKEKNKKKKDKMPYTPVVRHYYSRERVTHHEEQAEYSGPHHSKRGHGGQLHYWTCPECHNQNTYEYDFACVFCHKRRPF